MILPTVDTTMAEAARRTETLERPTWILAHHQAAGRGRQGKPWLAPQGNFSATYVAKPDCSAADAARRSFLAANALYQALGCFIEPGKLSLKWPNDVLLNGGKVAGILLESSGTGTQVDWLSIGIGVNLAHVPQGVTDALFAPTSLIAAGGAPATPEDFLTPLAAAYAQQERLLQEEGFDRIRSDWLRHAARIGEEIRASTGRETITGTFDTVDAEGNLVLITAKGPRAIPAAEVYF